MAVVYSNANNPFTLKLLICANYGKKVHLKIISSLRDLIPEPKHLPCLVQEGHVLFIANAAAYFLFPPNPEYEKIADEWLEWESSVLAPALTKNFGTSVKNPLLKNILVNCFEKLDDATSSKKWLIGKAASVCDIVIWSTLYPFYKDNAISAEYLSEFSNLQNWLNLLEIQPEFQEALKMYKVQPGSISYQVVLNSAKYISAEAATDISTILFSPQRSDNAVTLKEITTVKAAWLAGIAHLPTQKKEVIPVLPIPGERNILITSALPYVNNVPHLGNIIGCVLSADVFARFCRLCNYNTLYICGTDEYGTATETKALEEDLTPQQICDKYFEIHNSIYRWFNIGFDYFGRTTTPEQTKHTQRMFLDLNNNGFMHTQPVEQLLCQKCDRFLADRFVEGGCPHHGCNYNDARGDQCDGCGKLVNANELKNPRCKLCGTTPVSRHSLQFYLDLSKLEPLLYHWMEKSAVGWSNNARIIAKSWLKEGLKPRCITRDLKWGVPVPLDAFSDKVFYVWFDAPIGYISITERYTDQWEKWWKPDTNCDVKLYQFMAKDNVPFHSIMFPATLLGVNKGFTTVSHIKATEYLNYEDGKFSKSRGVGVFGNDAQNTGIPCDVWRFYLLYIRPESQDSSFCWDDFATKNNTELLNNLGNFVNRAQVFAEKFFNGTVPTMKLNNDDYILLALCSREVKEYIKSLENAKLRDGIRHILTISRYGNQYMQSSEPWVLVKGTEEEKERAGTVVGLCCNITCTLATLLFPYMPETSRIIQKQLNALESTLVLMPEKPEIINLLPSGHKLGKPFPLFSKIELAKIEELKKQFVGKQLKNENDNSSLDIPSLEAAIVKQGEKIQSLKASKVDKSVWQPELNIWLDLKNKLKFAQKTIVNTTKCELTENGISHDPQKIKNLQEEVNKQALLVRELKSSGASKADWQPEVNILLDLKAKLAQATGTPLTPEKKNKK